MAFVPLTIREAILPIIAANRMLVANQFGLRRYVTYLRRAVPSDGAGGLGSVWTNTDVALIEPPKIVQVGMRDEVRWGGKINQSGFIMRKITPRNALGTVGVNLEQVELVPVAVGEKCFIVLTGPGALPYSATGGPGGTPIGGSEFTIVGSMAVKNFEYEFAIMPAAGRS